MSKNCKDVISSIEAIERADNDLDIKRHDAIIKAKLDIKQKAFPYNFLNPLGAAVITGCVAVAVVLINNSNSKKQSADNHYRQIDLQDLRILTEKMAAGGDDGYICIYYDDIVKIPGGNDLVPVTGERVARYVVRKKLCGTDGKGIEAFAVRQPDAKQIQLKKEKEECTKGVEKVIDSCAVTDQAGFHGKPNASCKLILKAPHGKVFGKLDGSGPVSVDQESYRRLEGDPVRGNLKFVYDEQHKEFPVEITSSISCSNKRGTGRTCEASATISANAFPRSCIKIYEAETSSQISGAG